MDQGRREQLDALLRRLGRAVRSSVEDSDEVNACLAELHADGWQAVMLLEASLVCRAEADPGDDTGNLRVHITDVEPEPAAQYRLDAADARWLASLGLSPTRHRSQPRRALPPFHQALLPPPRDL